VAVFLPVGLMAGSVGKFFKPFGLTISAAVLFSLLVARTLTPVLSLWWLKPSQKGTSVILGPNSSLVKLYQRVLYWSLGHRKTVMALALASLLIGIAFIPFIPKGFVPKLDRGEFNVVYTTSLPRINLNSDAKEKSSNSTFSWMDDLAKSPESFLLKRTMYVGKKLESTILKSSDIDSAFTIAGNRGELNQGKIYVRMKSGRSRNTEQMQDYIRAFRRWGKTFDAPERPSGSRGVRLERF
jgi:multidrug efflux pump subunit AcrB